jgi:hypothetical protein
MEFAFAFTLIASSYGFMVRNRGVQREASKGVEDGRRQPALCAATYRVYRDRAWWALAK